MYVDVSKRRRNFSLTLQLESSGGIVALFGRSGSGKSTAIDLIAGLLTPDSGRIVLGGEVLFDSGRGIDVAAERRRIGYVFQDGRLFPHYSVRGNLEYGLRRAAVADPRYTAGRPRLADLASIVELLSLGPLLDRRPCELSGGEKQRTAIGRALLARPQLLLLDEPLAALDAARRDEVLPYLERLRGELSIPMIYVSHQYDEVLRLADHIVLLETGRVLAQGAPPAISTRPELRAVIGPDGIGTVVEGVVTRVDRSGLMEVQIGAGRLLVDSPLSAPGQRLRLQLLARDLILATEAPRGLSVRNMVQGTIVRLVTDDRTATLVDVDIGGVQLTARITTLAAGELALRPAMPLWVLVKAVTLRGHIYGAAAPPPRHSAAD